VFSLDGASPHRIDDFQESYFVIDSLDALLKLARIDFGSLYERLASGPEYQPGDVLPSDAVVSLGDGSHHAAKRRERRPRG
jgi:phenylalanine-4-hydroxylase